MTEGSRLGPGPGHPWPPDPTWPVLAPYFEGLQQGRLCFPQCTSCGRFVWYPQPMCPVCQNMDHSWTEVAPVGTIYTYTVLRRSFLPGFAEDGPLPLLLVDINGAPGVRLLTSLEDAERSAIAIGERVEIVIRQIVPGVSLPFVSCVT